MRDLIYIPDAGLSRKKNSKGIYLTDKYIHHYIDKNLIEEIFFPKNEDTASLWYTSNNKDKKMDNILISNDCGIELIKKLNLKSVSIKNISNGNIYINKDNIIQIGYLEGIQNNKSSIENIFIILTSGKKYVLNEDCLFLNELKQQYPI